MSRENKTTKKQLSNPEYFYEFMGHAPDNCKIIGNLNIIINMKKLSNKDWIGTQLSSFALDEVKNKNMEYTHVIWYNK